MQRVVCTYRDVITPIGNNLHETITNIKQNQRNYVMANTIKPSYP